MGAALGCNEGHDDGVEAHSTEWGYVGQGRGQYLKVPSYVFVGEGNGDVQLEEEVVETGYARRSFCFGGGSPTGSGIPCLIALLILGLAGVGIFALFDQRGGDKEPQKLQAKGIAVAAASRQSHLQFSRSELAPPRYICGADAGIDSASDALKVFDTDHDGRVSGKELHDCAHGTGSHAEDAGRGGFCELRELARKLEDSHLEAPLRYNELVTALAKVAAKDTGSWSSAKRIWCCVHAGVACPSTSPVPTRGQVVALAPKFAVPAGPEPFDCSAGFNDWWRSWSQAKMDWCCTNYERGCAAGASPPPPVPVVTLPPC